DPTSTAVGRAEFEAEDQEFEVEVSNLAAGTYHVFVNDTQVGDITVGADGEGKLELNNFSQTIDNTSVVQVKNDAGTLVRQGTFQSNDEGEHHGGDDHGGHGGDEHGGHGHDD